MLAIQVMPPRGLTSNAAQRASTLCASKRELGRAARRTYGGQAWGQEDAKELFDAPTLTKDRPAQVEPGFAAPNVSET